MVMHWLKTRLFGKKGLSFKKQLSNLYVHNTELLAIDLELTSLDTQTTSITSIGWAKGKGCQLPLNACEYYVIDTPAELGQSPVIHGLTQDILQEGVVIASTEA